MFWHNVHWWWQARRLVGIRRTYELWKCERAAKRLPLAPGLTYHVLLDDDAIADLVPDGDGQWAARGVDGADLGRFGTVEAAFASVAREVGRQ
jgi:hypothetical protein